jgi:hypothetical protein
MPKLLVLLSTSFDVRTVQIIESSYGSLPKETKCIDFSDVTGIRTVPLAAHLVPPQIQFVTLDDFLKTEKAGDYTVLSLLPHSKHTLGVFRKLRKRVKSISIVSLFIPWESRFKCLVRAFSIRVAFRPDKVHSFGKCAFASILGKDAIEYHPLPNFPVRTKPRAINSGNFIVFVDQALPTHPDVSVTGKQVEGERYYRSVTHALKTFSAQLNKKVLICRHPKGFYKGDEFGDLEISPDPTEKTLESAWLVVGHYSMALVTAAIQDIPIVILDVSASASSDILLETKAFSELLRIRQFREGVDQELLDSQIAKNTHRSELVSGYLYGVIDK